MPEVVLEGCQPEPLASYLKSLAILRLVATQEDADATARWEAGRLVLSSSLDQAALVEFLVERYRPSPVVTPWNGGSGFYPTDNDSGISVIEVSDAPRFALYRRTIEVCREVLRAQGLTCKPEKPEKAPLLRALRSRLPDEALDWFDAAVVVAGDDPRFPPLLGTGGNDGRLDFANNQMQRLVELLTPPVKGKPPPSRALAHSAVFGAASPGLGKHPIGQFHPSSAGGSNQGPGFDGSSVVNPWDYILMIEGALTFAASATRRLEQAEPGTMAYPFMVRASGVGYGSAVLSEEGSSRHELWLPLWARNATWSEVRGLFSEGRAKVAGRSVRTGVDFARAVATLGVDRGLSGFVRFAFHVRNGLSFFALPVGRWLVRSVPAANRIADLDAWLDKLRRASRGTNAPSSLQRAAIAVESALLDLCDRGDAAAQEALLLAVADAERVVARSPALQEAVPPTPRLGPEWLNGIDDSVEVRLATAFLSAGTRRHLVPVDPARPWAWKKDPDRGVVWGAGGLVRNLIAVSRRRQLEEPVEAVVGASRADLAAFVEGRVDDGRLDALIRALAPVQAGPVRHGHGPLPLPGFAVMALAWHRWSPANEPLPRTAGLLSAAAAGRSRQATELALRRLRGAGHTLVVQPHQMPSGACRRAAAALAFPVTPKTLGDLARPLIDRGEPDALAT